MRILILWAALVCLIAACTHSKRDTLARQITPSAGHLTRDTTLLPRAGEVPAPVKNSVVLPEPSVIKEPDRYTVVARAVEIKNLLFSLVRDANLDADIDPEIHGVVTINAIDQTLPQILKRLAAQLPIRYQMIDAVLVVGQDTPYLETYKIDYVNISRESSGNIMTTTQIAGISSDAIAGANGNRSDSSIKSTSKNHFWQRLIENVQIILGNPAISYKGKDDAKTMESSIIPSPETGLLTIRATQKQHKEIAHFVEQELASAHRQVLIQATIVEVTLSKDYQAGIDWSIVKRNGGAGATATLNSLSTVPTGTVSSFVLNYTDALFGDRNRPFSATVRLLEEFGDAKVLSSPLLMVLNNQTAILKVIDNEVYFELDRNTVTSSQGGTVQDRFSSSPRTLPVGIVMGIIPQISDSGSVILSVRPSISRVLSFVNDPNPDLGTGANRVNNPVPRTQVREFESLLRLNDGNIAVLGGLMQDDRSENDRGIPLLSRIPLLGKLFATDTENYSKVELVIFIRPTIVQQPSIERDLKQFRPFLEGRKSAVRP